MKALFFNSNKSFLNQIKTFFPLRPGAAEQADHCLRRRIADEKLPIRLRPGRRPRGAHELWLLATRQYRKSGRVFHLGLCQHHPRARRGQIQRHSRPDAPGRPAEAPTGHNNRKAASRLGAEGVHEGGSQPDHHLLPGGIEADDVRNIRETAVGSKLKRNPLWVIFFSWAWFYSTGCRIWHVQRIASNKQCFHRWHFPT